MPARIAVAAVGASVLALVLVSCVLFVSPSDLGTRCRFAGEETGCGACLSSKCQQSINACCAEEGCASTLASLERCANGDEQGCSLARNDDAAELSSRAAVARCLGEQCGAACRPDAGVTSQTQCVVPAFGDGKTCSCVVSSTPNDVACSEAAYPGTMCCAPEAWPSPSLRCSCRVFDCQPTANESGCLCRLQDAPANNATCESAFCCLGNGVCSCGALPCAAEDRAVPSCTFDMIKCPRGQKRVEACSLAK